MKTGVTNLTIALEDKVNIWGRLAGVGKSVYNNTHYYSIPPSEKGRESMVNAILIPRYNYLRSY